MIQVKYHDVRMCKYGPEINLKLSERMYTAAKIYAEVHGFDSMQNFIKENLRARLFEGETVEGFSTYLASERTLARYWLSSEGDEAWSHLVTRR